MEPVREQNAVRLSSKRAFDELVLIDFQIKRQLFTDDLKNASLVDIDYLQVIRASLFNFIFSFSIGFFLYNTVTFLESSLASSFRTGLLDQGKPALS